MPLPKLADKYLDLIKFVAKNNAVIHFYDFLNEDDIPNKAVDKIKKKVKKFKVLSYVKCGQYSPRVYRICLDFLVKR